MAQKKQVSKKKSKLPEGFKSARADRAEYFSKPFDGLVIRGLLLGRYPKRGRYPGFYYQIRAFEEVSGCEHKIGPNEYVKNSVCPPGAVVSIDERGGLKCLERHADGTREVYIACGEKRDIGDGQTAWDFEVGLKPFNSDDVPF